MYVNVAGLLLSFLCLPVLFALEAQAHIGTGLVLSGGQQLKFPVNADWVSALFPFCGSAACSLGFVCHRAWGGPRVPQVGQGYHWNPELGFQSSTYLPKVRGTWNPSPKGKGAEFLWPSS